MASPRQRFFFFLPLLFSLAWSGSVLAFEQDPFHNFSRDGRDASPPPPQPRPAGLEDIMSRHTASTILGDGQLRRSYMALVSMLSDTSRDVASRYGLSELGMFSDHLDDHLQDVNANTDSAYRLDLRKRDDQPKNDNETAQNETGMLKDFRDLITELMKYSEETAGDTNGDGSVGQVKLGLLGGLFGGLFGGGKKGGANNGAAAGGAAAGGGGAAAAPAAGGGGGGGLLGGLANLIPGVGGAGGGAAGGGLFSGIISNVAGGIFNKLLSATGNGLAGTGFFGGVGVGEGAAQGLNLATADKSKAAGEKVAQDNNMKNTGLNPIVQNAAMGLSATAVKAVLGSGLISLPPLPVLAASLGNGIGSGGAMGLGLTQKNLMPSANGSSQVVDAVGSFGFGTAMSFLGNMNTSGGLASMLPNIDFAAAASTVGTGLGSGAALGLKLTNNTQVAPPAPASQSDIPGIAGSFAFDLSRSFTGSIDGSSVGSLIPTNLDIGGAALNVGTGLGSGAARGLKLTTQDVAPPKPQSNTDVPGIAGTFAFGLSNSFTDNAKINLNSLGTMLPPIDFGSAALNVGNGLGKGAALGLKLTTDETGGGPEMMPAGPTALSAADVPKIAGTFALGLSRSFTGAVNVSNLGLGNALPADFDLGGAVSGAGRGLGSGASAGLGLTSKNVSAPVAKSSSDIPGLAEAFTFALSNSFTDNVNISAQAKNVGAMLPPIDIAATAMNAGAGLGLGAARGLNLTTNRELAFPPPKTLNDFPGVAGTFLFGLSDSFTGGINTSDLFSKLKSGLGGGDGPMMGGLDMNLTSLLTKFVAPAAAGLGKGLGKGAAVGLDLQPDAPANPVQPQPNGDPDIERITEGFAEGLSSRFLANGTTGKALRALAESTNTTGSPTSLVMNLVASIDVARAVNGFTQGLITGGGDGIMAIGGINAVLNGTSTAPTAPVADTNITFNDSVGGAAIGLGQGLGSSGVVTLQKLLAKGVNLNSMLDGLAPNKTKTKREDTTDVVLFGRQANSSAPPQETPFPSPSSSTSLHLSNILNADALTVITQKGVDVLTCDGVAGLFLVLAGFQKSGTLSVSDDPSKSNSSAVQGLIPDGTIRIYSEGNKFEIDGQKLRENLGGSMLRMLTTLTINDRPIGVFAVFLVLHIGGAILALLFLFPSVLTYDSLRDILVRLDRPGMLPTWPAKASRWVVMIVVAPSLVVIPIFGILAASSSNHFRTAHGILSIFTLLVAYAAVGLWFMAKPAVLPPGHNSIPANCPMDRWTYASKVCSQLLFALLLPTAGTGFADLNRVTLCLTRVVVPFDVAIMLGVGLGFVFVLAQYVTGAEMIMVFTTNRLAKKRSKELGSNGGRIQPVSEFLKA